MSQLDFLYSHFPPKIDHFVDVFFGSGAVILNRPPSKIETINDISHEIATLFRVLRDNGKELAEKLTLTPYSQYEYNYCKTGINEKGIDDLEKARRVFVAIQQSWDHNIKTYSNWKFDKKPGDHRTATWMNKIDGLWEVTERLRGVQIHNKDFRELLPLVKGAYPYCDPPYPQSSRKRNMYQREMTVADHEDLAEALFKHPGYWSVSSNDNDLYKRLYAGYHRHVLEFQRNRRGNKTIEVLYTNYGGS
jgi:DNA adenine methylase